MLRANEVSNFDLGDCNMKRIHFLTTACLVLTAGGAAFAADVPTHKAPPTYVAPLPIFSWTGLYVGGQVGYQWSAESSPTIYSLTGATVAGQPNYNQSGVIGGGHIGYNWQFNQIVLGIEGDVEGTNFEGTGNFGTGGALALHSEIDVQGSVRGRLGYAWDRLLVYATGGAAFAQLESRYTNTALCMDDYKTDRTGWTVGGGFQYAFKPNWSVGLEYRYTDLGHTSDLLLASSARTLGANRHETFNAVRASISYKFDFAAPLLPVGAKY